MGPEEGFQSKGKNNEEVALRGLCLEGLWEEVAEEEGIKEKEKYLQGVHEV
jgi:hypothetical protein